MNLRPRARLLLAAVLMLSSAIHAQESNLPPLGGGLHPVPLPSFDALEPAVADQLRAAQRDVRAAAARGATTRDMAAVYGSLARLFHAYELFDGAEAAYLNAITLAPAEVDLVYLLGYLYQQTGRWEDAAERLAAVIRLQPARREAAARLAEASLRLNRLRDARDQFTTLVDVFPALAQNGLGEVALRESRFTDAVGHFRAALARVPQATSIHYSLAMAYRGLGRLDQAQAELEKRGTGVIKPGDKVDAVLADLIRGERLPLIQGRRALEAGEPQAAAEWFGRAVAAAPGSTAARSSLGAVLLQLGRLDAAITQFEALVQLDSDDEEAPVTLAMALADRSRFSDAVAVLDRALARRPQSVATATTLARILAAAPDPAIRSAPRALEIAMRVYQLDPAPAHAETVALALAALSRCGEAVEWMRRAVSAAGRSGDAAEAARLTGELPKYEPDRCR